MSVLQMKEFKGGTVQLSEVNNCSIYAFLKNIHVETVVLFFN